MITGYDKNFNRTTKTDLKRAPDLPAGHAGYPGLYDSVQGNHDGSVMFIVYEGQQAYPLYLYTYKP